MKMIHVFVNLYTYYQNDIWSEKHLDLIKRNAQTFSIWTKLKKEAGPLINIL